MVAGIATNQAALDLAAHSVPPPLLSALKSLNTTDRLQRASMAVASAAQAIAADRSLAQARQPSPNIYTGLGGIHIADMKTLNTRDFVADALSAAVQQLLGPQVGLFLGGCP